MVDAACPCCTPWSMKVGITDVVYVGGVDSTSNKFVIWKFTLGGARTRFYPAVAGSVSGQCTDIACDRSGNVYAINSVGGGNKTVLAFDSTGTVIWDLVLAGAAKLAVSPGGYVYVAENRTSPTSDRIQKLDVGTGVAASGAWPYSFTTVANITGLCCDQSNNIFVVGDHIAATTTDNLIMLDSSATKNWGAFLSSGYSPYTDSFKRVEINLANDELMVGNASTTTTNGLWRVDASTGTFTAYPALGPLEFYAMDYTESGTRYAAGGDGSASASMVKNELAFGGLLAGSQVMNGLVCQGEDAIYLTSTTHIIKLAASGTVIWDYTLTGTEQAQCIAMGSGRIGAWGLR